MKKHALRIAQFLLTAGLLWWIFRDPEMKKIPGELARANPWWIAFGVFISGVDQIANAVRWWIFLRAQKIDVSLARATGLYMIGVFFNLLLPGSVTGDLVRVVWLARHYHQQKLAVVLTVAADRLIGVFILVPTTLVVALARYDWFSRTTLGAALLWFLIANMIGAVFFVGGIMAVAHFGWARRLPEKMPGRATIVRGAEAVQLFGGSWARTGSVLALSAVVLYTFFATWWCAARSIRAAISLGDVFSIMPIVAVVQSFPVFYNGLGAREEIFARLADVSKEIAVSVSLLGFAIYVFWSLVGAVVYAFWPAVREETKAVRAEA